MSAFRSDLAALTTERATLEQRTRESIALRSRLTAARRNLDAQRARKTELLTSLVERKELNAAYVEELAQAEARLQQLLAGLAGAEVAVPLGAFRGSLPWPVEGRVRAGFGRRKHPRFDTYTVHNGLEIEAPPDGRGARRARGPGRLRRPLPRLRPHGRGRPRRQAPLALRAAGGDRGGAGAGGGRGDGRWARPTRGARTGPGVYFEMRYQGRPEDPLDWLHRP